MIAMRALVFLCLLAPLSSVAKIFERVSDLPKVKYDFIVIGGGTAGNVIANRLTESPRINVLVLEAGPSNADVLNSMVPFYCGRLTPSTPYDWNYTTAAQVGLNNRSIPYQNGHILGGGSSVNFLAYTRGSSEDYDRYAKLTGDEGWSWKSLQPYIRKNERFTEPADHHNITGQFNPAVHGFNGVNGVSLPGFALETDARAIRTTAELSDEFPYNEDMNSGFQLGLGWTQSTIKDGERSSSATSYLGPQYIRRPNLHVLLHARVTRVLQTNPHTKQLAFRAVEFSQDDGASTHTITALKEVILSAGSIGTPHILLNSGIGDTSVLASFGIKPLRHLPSVGQNLSDHPVVGNIWFVNSTDTYETAGRNATLAAEQLTLWENTRTGPLVGNTFSQMGWFRLPSNATIFKQFPDPASGPHTAHFEFIIINGLSRGPAPATGNFVSIGTALVAPLSRGYVSLNSSNPLDPPVINPNMFSSDFDTYVMREAIRSARRFMAAPAWADYVLSQRNPDINATSDADLDQFIRSGAASTAHPVGTASMSAKGASHGVVDPDLLVKGVLGLRIVDASVLPFAPAAHTQAPVYFIAERAADLIKATWRGEL